MNVTLRPRIAAALLLVPVLSSCGFNAPVDQVYTPAVGVNERSGQVDVLNAMVVSGADGSGTLVAALSNNEGTPDALTRVAGSGEEAGLTVGLGGPVEIRPDGFVQLLDETAAEVDGQSVKPGAFIQLTFSFERAENVTVEVPVVARRGDYADIPVPSVAPATAEPETEAAEH